MGDLVKSAGVVKGLTELRRASKRSKATRTSRAMGGIRQALGQAHRGDVGRIAGKIHHIGRHADKKNLTPYQKEMLGTLSGPYRQSRDVATAKGLSKISPAAKGAAALGALGLLAMQTVHT